MTGSTEAQTLRKYASSSVSSMMSNAENERFSLTLSSCRSGTWWNQIMTYDSSERGLKKLQK